MKVTLFAHTVGLMVTGILWASLLAARGAEGLSWDARTKHYAAKPGDTNALLFFSVTNLTASNVVIQSVRPSCGCTIATLPAQPWIITPKGDGRFQLAVDLTGKRGTLNKHIAVDSSAGRDVLALQIQVPDPPSKNTDGRTRNLMAALADRQAVFQGACGSWSRGARQKQTRRGLVRRRLRDLPRCQSSRLDGAGVEGKTGPGASRVLARLDGQRQGGNLNASIRRGRRGAANGRPNQVARGLPDFIRRRGFESRRRVRAGEVKAAGGDILLRTDKSLWCFGAGAKP